VECVISTSAPSQPAHEIREATRKLSFWLDSLPDPRNQAAGNAPTPHQMTGLLSELLQAGKWLQAIGEPVATELQPEVAGYRKQVERLRERLPSIHEALLRERSHLEGERERLKAAQKWAQASCQTL
jgi:hypothetical protein